MRDLVAAAHRRLASAKPGNLPRKANSGTEIVVVIVVPGRAGIGRVLADKGDRGVRAANAGFHPIGKAGTRYSPDASRPADGQGHETFGFIRRTKIIPA